jgi:hypothetical protein
MFMLKPRHTTATCKRYFDVFLLNFGYGFLKANAKIKPKSNAIGAVISGNPNLLNGITTKIISST